MRAKIFVLLLTLIYCLLLSRVNSKANRILSGKKLISRHLGYVDRFSRGFSKNFVRDDINRHFVKSPESNKIIRSTAINIDGFLSQRDSSAEDDYSYRGRTINSGIGRLEKHHFLQHGCEFFDGFHFEGEVWYSRGCRRHTCLHFEGKYFVETDSCDSEIYNTTYKCVIEVDFSKDYPHCCPRYRCNPDNLGNRVNVIGAK
ncbi:hypothetical protein Avbf_01095 [Armadillidium vulgare]|nr:hypothetical protein Avbf_01095 [Armadillidium vulgare]